jgi:hypothetical protein
MRANAASACSGACAATTSTSILTHREFKEGAAERFEAILAAFPDDPINEPLVREWGFIMKSPMFKKLPKTPVKGPAKPPAKKAAKARR